MRTATSIRRYGFSVVSEPLDPTGIGIYGIHIATRIAALLADDERLTIFRHARFPLEVAGANVEHARLLFPAGRSMVRRLAEQVLVPPAALGRGLTLLHSVNNVAPALHKGPHVVTIHDTRLFETRAGRGLTTRLFREGLYPFAARRTERVICVSRSARDDVVRAFGLDAADAARRVRVVPNGVDPSFSEPQPRAICEAARGRLGIGPGDARPFLLFVGSFEPHKNVPFLIEAFARAVAEGLDALLVVAGGAGADSERVRGAVAAAGPVAAGRIRLPGYVDRRELPACYAAARAYVFPSRLEGFGLPVIEAFAAGTPVLCSDIPVFREVAGDAALLADTTDVAGFAGALRRIAGDEDLRRDLVARGRPRAASFTWDAAARATLGVYREVAPAGEAARTGQRS